MERTKFTHFLINTFVITMLPISFSLVIRLEYNVELRLLTINNGLLQRLDVYILGCETLYDWLSWFSYIYARLRALKAVWWKPGHTIICFKGSFWSVNLQNAILWLKVNQKLLKNFFENSKEQKLCGDIKVMSYVWSCECAILFLSSLFYLEFLGDPVIHSVFIRTSCILSADFFIEQKFRVEMYKYPPSP